MNEKIKILAKAFYECGICYECTDTEIRVPELEYKTDAIDGVMTTVFYGDLVIRPTKVKFDGIEQEFTEVHLEG